MPETANSDAALPNPPGRRFDLPESKLLYEDIITSIFQALVVGRIKPGERLVEENIARELNVSRSPVRQALQEMARQGIVNLVPRIGASVSTWSTTDIEDFGLLRVLIETLGARQAAARISPAELVALDRWVERMAAAMRTSETNPMIDSDIGFHRAIARASHNASLIQIYDSMVLRIRMFMVVEKRLYPSEAGRQESLAMHQGICEALACHEEQRASDLMEQHIGSSAKGLVKRMTSGGLPANGSDLPSLVESILLNGQSRRRSR